MNPVEKDKHQFPLTVTLTGMSDQTRAQIEYSIERGKNSHFVLAGDFHKPDVVIMDFDHPGTADRLSGGEWGTDTVLVVLAAGDRRVAGAITVAKPLNSAGLESAANLALQQLNGHAIPVNEAIGSQESVNLKDEADTAQTTELAQSLPKLTRRAESSRPDDSDTPAYFRTIDAALPGPSTLSMLMRIQRYQDKVDLLCGPPRTLEQLSDPHNTEHRYDLSRCLSQRVARVIFNPDPDIKAVHIKLPEAEIYVLPTLNKVYTSISLEYKRNVKRLFKDWEHVNVKVFEYDTNSVNQVIDTLNQSTRFSFGSQSFCWLSSLFSSQGRLPLGMDINAACKMKHWPNFTRLELIPDSLEIAAAWTGTMATLPEIVERVKCEPRYAVSFFNAACAINLMVGASE